MAQTDRKIDLMAAADSAASVLLALSPWCERGSVVGSIRRRRRVVSDIELLVEPRIEPAGVNLFGQAFGERVPLYEQIDQLITVGELRLRPKSDATVANGERYKRLEVRVDEAADEWVPLDLFICRRPAQWGVLELIRTGPASFSQACVTERWNRGFLPNRHRVDQGAIWSPLGQVVPTPTEQDAFDVLDLQWIPPHQRDEPLELLRVYFARNTEAFDATR